MPRIPKLDEPRRAKLISLLAEGEWLSDALKAIGISRATLHRAECADREFETQVKRAVAGGIRYKIDDAMARLLAANSKDASIIGRHIMEAAEKRARLLAPERYHPQTQANQPVSANTTTLTIQWMQPDAIHTNTNEKTINHNQVNPDATKPVRLAYAKNGGNPPIIEADDDADDASDRADVA